MRLLSDPAGIAEQVEAVSPVPEGRARLSPCASGFALPHEAMGMRRVARECALQMLYEYDVGRLSLEEILEGFWEMNEHPKRVRDFANQLFQGSLARMKEIDKTIQQHTKNWRLSRMAAVDRNILRLAVFEFLSDSKTPETVVINEALEIAKKFSTHESAQFVNGILDSIKNDLRSANNEAKA